MLLDCRWLSHGGAGRLTELLLRGLSASPPEGRWLLWGPPELAEWVWAGADVVVSHTDPRTWYGQREWADVPECDIAVYLHQQRPLRKGRSVTVVYDTIPLRYATNPAVRMARRIFLQTVASRSELLVTLSGYSRRCITRDLGVASDRVAVVGAPFDDEQADRVFSLRRELPGQDVALYVGNFLPHKNLPRLVRAFEQTEFCRSGGRLMLVGGSEQDLARQGVRLAAADRDAVQVRGRCSQDDLDRLMATSLLLVQPSLEEGFGLPAWEAMCCGLAVCVSDGGSLPEVTRGLVKPFLATSTAAMTAAIDDCVARARETTEEDSRRLSDDLRATSVTIVEFAQGFAALVADALG